MLVNPNSKFVLLTDSCCDLTRAYLDEHEVGVLHFTYTESGKPDGGLHGVDDLFESLSAHEFYDAIRAGAQPMTSQPSPAEFEDVFRAGLATGKPVVYLAFDSGISGCYEGAVAVQARLKEELGEDIPLYVVDTLTASITQTLLVVEAIRLRDEGVTAEQLVAWAEEAHNYAHVMFMVDDLTALARGGRIPSGAAKIGSLLGVKPMLSIALDGKLTMAGVARGRKKAMRKFVDLFEAKHDSSRAGGVVVLGDADVDFSDDADGAASNVETPGDSVVVGNADCPDDAEALVGMLREIDPGVTFVKTNIGPTIGCHVGPGMMAIAFWGPDRRIDEGGNKE